MARKTNYAFERKARAQAKAAKREAKREAKAAAKAEKTQQGQVGELPDDHGLEDSIAEDSGAQNT